MYLPFRHPSEHRLGIILAFGALLWSGTYNALAKGLTPYVSPVTLLLLSESLTALFIALTFGVVPLCRKCLRLPWKTIRTAALIGLLNSAIAPLLWFYGLSQTSAMNASLLSCADILCILVLSHFILGESISKMQGIGASVVLIGVLVLNLGGGDATSSGVHIGDLLVLTAATVSGAGSVLFKKYLSDVMPELAILIRNIASIVVVGSFAFFAEHPFAQEVQAFPLKKVLLLLAFTFFSRYLNLTFYYEALDRMSASAISLIEIASPLSGLLFAYLILGEVLHSYQMLGVIFIVLGLLLEQLSVQAVNTFRSRLFHSHMSRMERVRV